jgi:uncharacterized protein (TIGR00369 family)
MTVLHERLQEGTVGDLEAEGWVTRQTSGYMGLVGPVYARREGAAWAYGVRAGAQHLNQNGKVHGGMLATLADSALGMIVWEAVERRPCVTVQLNTQFVSAASAGEFIEARADIVRKTRSLVFVRGELTVESRIVIAVDGIWKILSSRE